MGGYSFPLALSVAEINVECCDLGHSIERGWVCIVLPKGRRMGRGRDAETHHSGLQCCDGFLRRTGFVIPSVAFCATAGLWSADITQGNCMKEMLDSY